MSVADFFQLFAAIILVGWLGQVFFDRTRIPDVLLLLGLGILLGPVLALLPAEPLRATAPYFGTLALVIILFEGGLKLGLRDLLHQFAPASVLTLLAFLVTASVLALAGRLLFSLDWTAAALLGAILSGAPSGVVAIPVINRMRVSDSTRTVVSLEASLSDILCILAVVMGLDLLGSAQAMGPVEVLGSLAATFIVSGLFAALVGFGWLAVLNAVRGHSLSYMLTLAVLFLCYALSEKAGGSGALSVLLTGAVVANAEAFLGGLGRRLKPLALQAGVPEDSKAFRALDLRRWFAPMEENLLRFNGEVSFIVRTFFFVFLGAVVQVPRSGATLLLLLAAFAAALAARALALAAFTFAFKSHRGSYWPYLLMAPRGLAAAVLAYLPASRGLPGTGDFPVYAFAFIVLSNVLLTVGVPILERGQRRTT